MKSSKKQIGNNGETRACTYLESTGFSIFTRNFRTNSGEIDIIAVKHNTVVFIEVKTLPKGTPEILSKVLDQRKQKRIIETSKRFLSKHRQYNNSYIRFDVIVIDMPGFPEIYHIENAFSEFL